MKHESRGEGSGSIGRVLDWVASLRLTGVTVLCPCARHFINCLVLVQPRKTGNHPDMTETC